MFSEVLKPIVQYMQTQPFNNVLIAVLMGVIVYFNVERNKQTKESHDMVHCVFQEIREESQKNQDRLVKAMIGVRTDIQRNTEATKEIPEAAAVAAEKIVKKAEAKGQ